MNISGKWTGEYTYGETYPENVKGKSVRFQMEITVSGIDISGYFSDDESRRFFPEGGTLYGIIENSYISFTKEYPCLWYFTETGEIKLEENSPSQEIIYEGFFENGKYEGRWEIPFYEEKEEYPETEYSETLGNGTWSMWRDE
ncbi:MAG: hypothetical protein QM687_11815 [Ferruginibacter sp.]